MKKIQDFLSPKGREKLAIYTKKRNARPIVGEVPIYVVGIHVNETELICSKAKQASGRQSTDLPSIKKQRKKVEWKGVTDFVVPPNCFDFFCAQNITYKEALFSFIKESTFALVKEPLDGAVVVAFSFPVHILWDGSQSALQTLLDQCFADCDWIIPTIVSIFEYYSEKENNGFVYVDKTWTTFFMDKNKHSVAFGTATDFRRFQCNDYLNNSTGEWSQKSYSSWEHGFLDICHSLSKNRKGTKQKFVGFADEKNCGIIGKAMTSSNLAVDAVSWGDPAEITMKTVLPSTEKTALQNKGKYHRPSPENHGTKEDRNPPPKKERPIKTTEDLFKW